MRESCFIWIPSVLSFVCLQDGEMSALDSLTRISIDNTWFTDLSVVFWVYKIYCFLQTSQFIY